MSTCNFNYFPVWFRGQEYVSDLPVPACCSHFTFYKFHYGFKLVPATW